MSGLLESIKELIKNEYGAVSDKEFTGLLSPGGRKLGFKSDKEKTYGIEVDGEEKDYTFTGDRDINMDRFRETHGITKGADSDADAYPATIRYLMSKGQVELAGLVSNGKMAAEDAINIANKLENSPQGILGVGAPRNKGAMSQEEIGKYPDLGWTNVNDSQEVKTFLNNMPHADRVQVEAMRQRVTEPQFQDFVRQIMAGQIGGGAIHEALPFQQYNTGTTLQNLGF